MTGHRVNSLRKKRKRGEILFSFFHVSCMIRRIAAGVVSKQKINRKGKSILKKEKPHFWEKIIPAWAIMPLLSILIVNGLVYWGSGLLTENRIHYDFTTALDRAVPLIPEFVWIYILAFPFWAVSYILAARRGKDWFYRFVATDLTIHALCFVIFILVPTTNIRPEIAGDSFSEVILKLIYALDGGKSPSNLFPSIHCYVSWLCWRGLKGAGEIPRGYQIFSLFAASLVIISTQVLKQHYLADAIGAIALVELWWRFYAKGNRHHWVVRIFERKKEMDNKMGDRL